MEQYRKPELEVVSMHDDVILTSGGPVVCTGTDYVCEDVEYCDTEMPEICADDSQCTEDCSAYGIQM